MSKFESQIQVAICEDDDDLREILVSGLPHYGLRTFGVGSVEALEHLLATREVDLLVLDIGLPGEDGFSAARRLRSERPGLGITMLTARGLLDDRIRGLKLGADSYFVKPVDLQELAAALHNLYGRLARGGPQPASTWHLLKGRAVLETPGGLLVDLTHTEQQLLSCLMAKPGQTFDRECLFGCLGWHYDGKGDHRLETTLSRLRTKVTRTGEATPLPLKARHGLGYAFLVDDPPAP